MLACFLFAFWVGQRVDASFSFHGALLGVVAALMHFGLTHGHPEQWDYIVAQVLNIPCGAAGGLVAGRQRSLLGNREVEQTIVVAPYEKALSIACGLLVGGFLFQRFGFDSYEQIYGWRWYLGAVLLGTIGLAGIFPEVRSYAAIGPGIAPAVVFCYVIVYLNAAESMWPIVLPMILLCSHRWRKP